MPGGPHLTSSPFSSASFSFLRSNFWIWIQFYHVRFEFHGFCSFALLFLFDFLRTARSSPALRCHVLVGFGWPLAKCPEHVSWTHRDLFSAGEWDLYLFCHLLVVTMFDSQGRALGSHLWIYLWCLEALSHAHVSDYQIAFSRCPVAFCFRKINQTTFHFHFLFAQGRFYV